MPTVPDDVLKKKALTLSVEDVSKFLVSINLEEHIQLFKSNDVDGDLLWGICDGQDKADNDLKDLGVGSGFHRRKIIRKFKPYLQELVSDSVF